MGSSNHGEPSFGRSGPSRKGKKCNVEKPKQPQRGLGVAQLEKIRLREQVNRSFLPALQSPTQSNLNLEEKMTAETAFPSTTESSSSYNSASSFGFWPNIMFGFGDGEPTEVKYEDSVASATNRTRWNNSDDNNNIIFQPQNPVQSSVTFLRLSAEDSAAKKRRQDRFDSMGSSSQNSDSSNTQEIDLDLKL